MSIFWAYLKSSVGDIKNSTVPLLLRKCCW